MDLQTKNKIRREPLTTEEKKKLKFILKVRLIIGAFFGLPLTAGFILMGTSITDDIISGTSDGMTYFSLVLVIIVLFLIIRFVIPFYKNSFKNLIRKDKLVVDTIVISAAQRWTSKGYKYSVQTEYRSLDSWAMTTVMQPSLHLRDMSVNMPITIHCLEDNRVDILYIEKTKPS